MKIQILTTLAVLNLCAFGHGLLSDMHNSVSQTKSCKSSVTRESIDSSMSGTMQLLSDSMNPRVPITPIKADCSDCEVVDSETDQYCEVRSEEDCGDWWNWFDDDFKWNRNVNIYLCPDNKQYRKCDAWARNGCCTDGSAGQPPSDCGTKNGRKDCASRVSPSPTDPPGGGV